MPDPVTTLPYELMDSIIYSLLTRDERGFVRPVKTKPPLSFLMVSKSWNAFMLDNPEYWRSIRFDIVQHTDISHVAGIDKWLERTAYKPLSFRLTGTPHWGDDLFYLEWERLLPPFLKRKSKWQHVDLGLLDTVKQYSEIVSNAPILRSFNLDLNYGLVYGIRNVKAKETFKADLTKCFLLERLQLPRASSVTVHEYNNIQHLEMVYERSRSQLLLLLSCTQLKSLTISTVEVKEKWTGCPMTFHDLRTLQIRTGESDPSENIKHLARTIKAPQLHTLIFEQWSWGNGFNEWVLADIVESLLPFLPSVEELHFSITNKNSEAKAQDVIKLLSAAPRIKKLLLNYSWFSEEVCDALQYRLCPNLAELVLSPGIGGRMHPSVDRICALVKTRSYSEGSQFGTLKTVRCQGSKNFVHMQKELRDFALSVYLFRCSPYDHD